MFLIMLEELPASLNEEERLRALYNYKILDTPKDEKFNRFVELASLICGVPISLITLVDEKRQWFKANKGFAFNETSRDLAFCQYAIMDNNILEVEDATKDGRFKDNRLVKDDPYIRFYAGQPLIDPNGHALGTLCVIDKEPKQLTDFQKKTLKYLADGVVELIIERWEKEELEIFEKLFNSSKDLICIINENGFIVKSNKSFEKNLGLNVNNKAEYTFFEFIHSDDLLSTKDEIYKLEDVEEIKFENRVQTINKKYLTIQWSCTKDDVTGNLFAIGRDVSDIKKVESDLEILTKKLQNQNYQLLNYAHITSHNLRSPVSNLSSLLYLYEESKTKEDKEFLFKKFEQVIKQLSTTLEELMNALIIKQDINIPKVKLNFTDVILKAKESLIGQIILSKAIITYDFTEVNEIEYPKAYLESIFLNLLSNAIKYRSDKRLPNIHFQTKVLGNHIILTVKDNGLGIDLIKNGDKLFGLNKVFHRHPESKGFGLFITKTQIESMNGQISAESIVDVGTTFKIIFNITGND